ncbi:MAG TPA: polysaccharide (de)acetylase [Saprospiraceae bacterium]|nr:polysaccharide (de)acetylase [Saprospiraceae bacterium]
MSFFPLKIIRRNLASVPGWKTRRKLVVIESDDWGSLRMPDTETFTALQRAGIDIMSDDGAIFNAYDTLADSDDLSGLFEVLSSVRDQNGLCAVMTPVSVVANPDFDSIRKNGFKTYFFEPFTETLKKFKGCEDSFKLWQEGIRRRIFVPQFHGREHLNVKAWLRALDNGNKNAKIAFNHGFWGMSTQSDPDIGLEFQAAFDYINPVDLDYHKEVITTGLDLFSELFGYRASYFVPPNGPFSSNLETALVDNGIKYISMPRIYNEPVGFGRSTKMFNWMGKTTRQGLKVITRNCFFEPATSGKDWVDSCLSEISKSFRFYNPAVLSTHRVNYVGRLSVVNRERGLNQLSKLLVRITQRWPEVEFITSDELGSMMKHD